MLKTIFQSIFTRGTIAIINLGILIASSRYLGLNSRGEISLFILNIAITQGISEVYTGYGLIRFIPQANLKQLLMSGLIFSLFICTISNVILLLLNKQIPGFEWAGFVISFLVVYNTFNCVLLMGKQKINWYNRMSLVQPILLLIFLCLSVFVFKVFTFAAFVYPLFFSFLIATVVSAFLVNRLSKAENKGDKQITFKSILSHGLLYQASVLLYIFCNRYSYYLLPDKASLGLYSSATVLSESVLIIANALAPVLMTTLANLTNKKEAGFITAALAGITLLLCTIGMALVVCLPESMYTAILGKSFTGIQSLMWNYAPAVLLAGFAIVISSYFTAMSNQKVVLFSYGLGFMSVFVLAPYLIGKYGTVGAAYAANIAFVLVTLILTSLFILHSKAKLSDFMIVGIANKKIRNLLKQNAIK